MYEQMGYTFLIAASQEEYIAIVLRLFREETERQTHAVNVMHRFGTYLHKNSAVAEEWLLFLLKAWTSLYRE